MVPYNAPGDRAFRGIGGGYRIRLRQMVMTQKVQPHTNRTLIDYMVYSQFTVLAGLVSEAG
jgi:hypothetical protein